MNHRNRFCLNSLALAGIVSLAKMAPALADPPTRPTTTPGALPTSNVVASNIARAEQAMDANALVLAYGDAVRDPQLARITLTQLLTSYFQMRSLATSAMQASQSIDEAALRFSIFQAAQNQVNVQQNQQALALQQRIADQNDIIIKQNERILVLLDQIAKKR